VLYQSIADSPATVRFSFSSLAGVASQVHLDRDTSPCYVLYRFFFFSHAMLMIGDFVLYIDLLWLFGLGCGAFE
jgi:hypothetical protein